MVSKGCIYGFNKCLKGNVENIYEFYNIVCELNEILNVELYHKF